MKMYSTVYVGPVTITMNPHKNDSVYRMTLLIRKLKKMIYCNIAHVIK